MIILSLTASAFVVLFFILSIESTFGHIILYKKIPNLKPKVISFYHITLFNNNEKMLIALPNIDLRFYFGNISLSFDFGSLTEAFTNLNKCSFVAQNFHFAVTKDKITIKGNGEIKFLITRPNAQFFFKPKEQSLIIKGQENYSFKFIDFFKLTLRGGDKLEFSGVIKDFAEIDYSSLKLKVDKKAKQSILKNLFGFFNTDKWENLPTFDTLKGENNALKVKYQKEVLNAQNKSVFIPNEKANFLTLTKENFSIDSNFYLNLDALGCSKLVRLRKYNKNLIISDLLCNFKINIVFTEPFEFQQCRIFGVNYVLLLISKSAYVKILFLNKYLDNSKLPKLLLYGVNFVDVPNISLSNVFYNLNRLVLHGVFCDVYSLFCSIRINFLNKFVRFQFANLLLNFLLVFERYELLNNKTVKLLFYDIILKSIDEITPSCYLFLKKILPFVTDEKMYNLILDKILSNKDKINLNEYEFVLNEKLGIRLNGRKFYICPRRDEKFFVVGYFAGHKITIKKTSTASNIKIDKLYFSGVDFIDLRYYPTNIEIEFTD